MLVQGDFNATTGTDGDGYQSHVGPQGYGLSDESPSMLLDFAISRRLRVPEAGPGKLDLVFT